MSSFNTDILNIPSDTNNKENQETCSFKLTKKLGEGTFGIVRLAKNIQTGEQVAIKIMEKGRITNPEDRERIAREKEVLLNLHHSNIIHLYNVLENEKFIYLIMEYVQGKELFDYIIEHQRLKENEACKYFQQIISGLEYLHKHNIVHRDIKPENLLLDNKTKDLKLVDFGLSNLFADSNNNYYYLQSACGSPSYAAPEMLSGNEYKAPQVDIWSAGIVLYGMVCGYLPFEDEGNDNEFLYKKIKSGKYTTPPWLSAKCKDLIKKILVTDPEKRITIQEIKKHPWFNQVDQNTNINKGLLLNEIVIPIDNDVVKEMIDKYGFKNAKEIKESVLRNKHNDITTIYYLIARKKIRKGNKSVVDLKSDVFLKYLNDPKNKFEKYHFDINEVIEKRVRGGEIKGRSNRTNSSKSVDKKNKKEDEINEIIIEYDDNKKFDKKDNIKKEESVKKENEKEENIIDQEIAMEIEKLINEENEPYNNNESENESKTKADKEAITTNEIIKENEQEQENKQQQNNEENKITIQDKKNEQDTDKENGTDKENSEKKKQTIDADKEKEVNKEETIDKDKEIINDKHDKFESPQSKVKKHALIYSDNKHINTISSKNQPTNPGIQETEKLKVKLTIQNTTSSKQKNSSAKSKSLNKKGVSINLHLSSGKSFNNNKNRRPFNKTHQNYIHSHSNNPNLTNHSNTNYTNTKQNIILINNTTNNNINDEDSMVESKQKHFEEARLKIKTIPNFTPMKSQSQPHYRQVKSIALIKKSDNNNNIKHFDNKEEPILFNLCCLSFKSKTIIREQLNKVLTNMKLKFNAPTKTKFIVDDASNKEILKIEINIVKVENDDNFVSSSTHCNTLKIKKRLGSTGIFNKFTRKIISKLDL